MIATGKISTATFTKDGRDGRVLARYPKPEERVQEPYRTPPPMTNGQTLSFKPTVRALGEMLHEAPWTLFDADGSIVDRYPTPSFEEVLEEVAREQVLAKQGRRREVYDAIDGERDYQDRLQKGQGGRTDGQTKQVGAFLSLMQHALNEAHRVYYEEQGNGPALEFVRKILGLGVQCGEIHGLPKRRT